MAESDTLRIVYNFNGKKGPVSITIFNKSDMPLQVDWKKSALIIDDKPIAYYQPDWNINGSISTSPGILTTSSSTLQANVTGREGLEFLPPHSFISRKGRIIKNNNDFFAMPADVVNEKIKVQGFSKKMVKGFFTRKTRHSFSGITSPLYTQAIRRRYFRLIIPFMCHNCLKLTLGLNFSGLTPKNRATLFS